MNKDVLLAKQETVSEIVSKAKDSSALVVAEYRGLTVEQIQELRRELSISILLTVMTSSVVASWVMWASRMQQTIAPTSRIIPTIEVK